MRKALTDRQREIYGFIVDTIVQQGVPPTIREIGVEFGITSTNGVRSVLEALVKKGYIKRHQKRSRGIELTDFVERKILMTEIRNVPILGRVAAGAPILALENMEGTLAVDRTLVPSDEVFALRVHGDSMKDAGILDGDYVFAHHQPQALRGDIVVAVIGEEATVKRYLPEDERIVLMPENEAYLPIVVDGFSEAFRIAGKVVGLMRKMD
ncbi:MAG: transcriptional repressor LexA [Candidatus Latescibacteria bacterium]|nr:transcriptional repressor LexA [Candidatus Latescibacterota bacterium]